MLHRRSHEFDPTNKTILSHASNKMLCYNDKVSLLSGKLSNKMWKLSLCYLNTENKFASWKPILNFNFSISESLLDFENCIAVSHKESGLILVSVSNDRIIFHVYSKNSPGKKWVSASSQLPPPSQVHSAKYKIQSCVVISNFIYCSLLQGMNAHIYKFSIRLLQQQQRGTIPVRPNYVWHINEDGRTLTNCFVTLHKGEVAIISCYVTDDKSSLEVKYLKSEIVSASRYKFHFPYKITIACASIITDPDRFVIAMIYTENNSKCYVKRIEMS